MSILNRAIGHHREGNMYLEVKESDLEALFNSRPMSGRKHTATHLQRKWLQALPAVQQQAILGSRLMSHSYRDFRVGAAAFCYSQNTGEFQIFNAGNLKLWEGSDKQCAETALLKLIPSHFCCVGFGIYGETVQPDSSGHAPRTLHPCDVCRARMNQDPRVHPWTRIFTFRPWMEGDLPEEATKNFVREHMSFRELKRLHSR